MSDRPTQGMVSEFLRFGPVRARDGKPYERVSLKIYAVYAVGLIFGLEQYRLMLQFNRLQVWALEASLDCTLRPSGLHFRATHSTTSDSESPNRPRRQLRERGSVMLSRERCSASTPNASSTAAAISIRMAAIA
jgi:hypothetical protein